MSENENQTNGVNTSNVPKSMEDDTKFKKMMEKLMIQEKKMAELQNKISTESKKKSIERTEREKRLQKMKETEYESMMRRIELQEKKNQELEKKLMEEKKALQLAEQRENQIAEEFNYMKKKRKREAELEFQKRKKKWSASIQEKFSNPKFAERIKTDCDEDMLDVFDKYTQNEERVKEIERKFSLYKKEAEDKVNILKKQNGILSSRTQPIVSHNLPSAERQKKKNKLTKSERELLMSIPKNASESFRKFVQKTYSI